MAGRSSITPGIVSEYIETGGEVASAGINEISELMQELGKPTFIQTEYEYDRKGNVIRTRSWNVSKLDALIIVGGPAFATLFYVLMERLTAIGGDWRPGDAARDVVGPAGQWLQDRAEKRGGQVGEAAASGWDLISTLWGLRPGVVFK